jgi:hypothetical protein
MTRYPGVLCLVLLAGTMAPAAADNRLASPTAHVRWMDNRSRHLLEEGARRSPTLAGMLEGIEATDLIVYVETRMDGNPASTTRLLVAPPGARFLLVTVRIGPGFELIPALGHELRHVLEIAADREVRSDDGMRALFRRIGWRSHLPDCWETDAAIQAGRQVQQELWRNRGTASPLRAAHGTASDAPPAFSGSASPRR